MKAQCQKLNVVLRLFFGIGRCQTAIGKQGRFGGLDLGLVFFRFADFFTALFLTLGHSASAFDYYGYRSIDRANKHGRVLIH